MQNERCVAQYTRCGKRIVVCYRISTWLAAHAAQAVVSLREQFRMNTDIMSLSNTLVYSGQLRCGSQAVAEGVLLLPCPPAAGEVPAWLLEVRKDL